LTSDAGLLPIRQQLQPEHMNALFRELKRFAAQAKPEA
jgi:hypothetical protein